MTKRTVAGMDVFPIFTQAYNEIEALANIASVIYDPVNAVWHFSPNLYSLLHVADKTALHDLNDLARYMHPSAEAMLNATQHEIEMNGSVLECKYMIGQNANSYQLSQTGKSFAQADRTYIQLILKRESSNAELQNEKYTDMVFDASIDCNLVFDNEYKIILWNHYCEIISGRTQQEVLGKTIFEVYPDIHDCADVIKAMNHALRGYTTFVPADKSKYEDGHFENHFIPLRNNDGEILGVLNVKHDVSHRVRAENELKTLNKSLARKNKELKQRNAEMRSFAHVTSHDLKEPLRKIYTFAELILSKESAAISNEGKVYFRRIQAAVQRMGLLTDDILTFSQLDIDDTPLSDLDLNKILQIAQQNLYGIIDARKAFIQSEALPVFKGHRQMITQLFQNILSNAVKFQKDGNVPLIKVGSILVSGKDLKHADASEDSHYLKISFSDNGIGFEKKYTERIFQMFMRLNSNDKFPGSGVGLALCKKIAELHHGFITAESRLGAGSTFHCYLQTDI